MSWFEPETLRIRDEGAEASIDTEARAALTTLRTDADPSLHTYLDRAIEATVTPERPPWPEGVYVLIKERMQGKDYDVINKEGYRMQQLMEHMTVSAAGQVSFEGARFDPMTLQASALTAAINITGFLEPTEDGKPTLNGGKGVWTMGGKPVNWKGKTLEERVEYILRCPPVVYNFVAGEVNRVNQDPLGLRKPAPSSKTA